MSNGVLALAQPMTREDAFARLDFAQESWTAALEAHWSAPPAPGFAERLIRLANAAEELSNAVRFADPERLRWTLVCKQLLLRS